MKHFCCVFKEISNIPTIAFALIAFILLPSYGSLPPLDKTLSQTLPNLSSSTPHQVTKQEAKEMKDNFSRFHQWFKHEVHFSLIAGIQDQSPQQIIQGLQNIQSLFQGIDKENATPEIAYLKGLHILSQNYLSIFQQLPNQTLIEQNNYGQLQGEYTTLLEEASAYYSTTLSQNKFLVTIVEGIIAQDSQTAGLIKIVLIAFSILAPPSLVVYLGLRGSFDEVMANEKSLYKRMIKRCDRKYNIQHIRSRLYSDEKIRFYCSSKQEDIDIYETSLDEEFLVYTMNHREELCRLTQRLRECMSKTFNQNN